MADKQTKSHALAFKDLPPWQKEKLEALKENSDYFGVLPDYNQLALKYQLLD
jgi:hypothetical protein